MKLLLQIFFSGIAAAAVAGCASFLAAPVQPGQSEADVIAALGRPTNLYRHDGGHTLEYMRGPMGQTTHMARFGPDGRLATYEQVLTVEKFGSLKVGEADEAQVLRTVGAPSETRRFSRVGLNGWSYPYKEDEVWDSMMTLFFDDAGVLRRMENGPDPYRMPNDSPTRD